nr:L-xylulose reductase [Rachicladosporium sp. CCFEE 5018]
MVRGIPNHLASLKAEDKKPSPTTSPEDASMHNGIFHEYNTTAPKSSSIHELFSLKHKTAIVSGAGAGIGLEVARALAEAGANVAIWYHSNKDAIDKAAAIEQEFGVKGTSRAYQVDVTSASAVKDAIEAQVSDFNNRLDIFVANAGIPWTQGRMIDGQLSHYHNVVSTDLDSVFYCAQAAGEVWRRQYTASASKTLQNYSGGSFVATASMSGHIANIPQLQSAYNAAKAGVIHLVRSLAVEWVKFARANSVSPGYINTEISKFIPPETKGIWRGKIPMGREGEPGELKGAYLYLASDASSYTTGTDIRADGGYTAV